MKSPHWPRPALDAPADLHAGAGHAPRTHGRTISVGLSVFTTLLIFLALPFANYIGMLDTPVGIVPHQPIALSPPPPPFEKLPPPEPIQDAVEKPELEPEPSRLTLEQIDTMLHVGTGSAGGPGLRQTLKRFSALAELDAYDISELDKPPAALQRIAPVYPYEAKQRGQNGWVKLLFIVDEAGAPQSIRVDSSSDHIFELSAIEAVRMWKFTPGVKDGRNVRTRMLLPFVFKLSP